MPKQKRTERVKFTLLIMPCCNHQLCWINPRLPTFCPECGQHVYPAVRSCGTFSDDEALLIVHAEV